MANTKIITREKIEEKIPFCYGILQRLADDLNVTRAAISRFLNLPEKLDLKEMVKEEKKRIREYAEMTVMKHLISGDIETAKWFLTAFPSNGLAKKPKPYKPKKSKQGYILLNVYTKQDHIRELSFPGLDFVDGKLPGAVTEYLPYGMKEKLGLIPKDPDEISDEEVERRMQLRQDNTGKSGHEIYEEFKKNRGL